MFIGWWPHIQYELIETCFDRDPARLLVQRLGLDFGACFLLLPMSYWQP